MTKILVIEDELPVRENMLELLEAEGFDAIDAENGRLGVQLARESLPDLILCDVMMPELDGFGVLTALRSEPTTATIPFIFITAKADKADLRQGMNLGADDYLTKPFTRAELLGAIATRLEKRATVVQRYNVALQEAAERLNYLLYYDSLTGLPNRLLLRERFHQVLQQVTGNSQLVMIMLLDINRFSRINETLGRACGDLLLKSVAERLRACIGEGDTVARLSADQFAILFAFSNPAAASVAQVILDTLSQPFILNGQEVFITTSTGITFYPSNGSDIDTLIQHGEIAMNQARRQGGHNYQFYTEGMKVVSSEQLVLETSLRYALEQSQFEVYYQPQVDLATGKIAGTEALVRWRHPDRGLVSPAEFIPLAEATGLIIPIGEWVLRTACQQTQRWREAGFSHLRVAVNLSGRQFNQPRLSRKIVDILSATDFDPRSLELELTESIIMQDAPAAIATLSELQGLGIKIAIDDFGTGYSSLSYLKQFPFNTLKIDRSFIRNLVGDPTNTAITTALIQIAHDLNLTVIAEGVETEAELAFLRQHRCDAMQGYLFSRPLPAAELELLLMGGRRLMANG